MLVLFEYRLFDDAGGFEMILDRFAMLLYPICYEGLFLGNVAIPPAKFESDGWEVPVFWFASESK